MSANRLSAVSTPKTRGTKQRLNALNRRLNVLNRQLKASEEALHERTRQIEFILGATKTGLDIIDASYNLRYVDPEWAKTYGDWHGRKCHKYFMDKNAPCQDCGIPNALSTKKAAITEEMLVKEGGRPIQVTTIPFKDKNGDWLVAEVNTDITERKKAEETLFFKNTILTTQQEASIDGILIVDENGKIISSNRRFAGMWGIPPDVIKSRSDERALRSVMDKLADPEEFIAKVKHLYEARNETSMEEINLKDRRVFERYSAPMFGADKKYYGRVWYFRDITERKRLEEQITHTQKMESIGNLAGGIAHDFNNLLTTIKGYSELAKARTDKENPLYNDLNEIIISANIGGALTRQLLLFSRKQPIRPVNLLLNKIIENISKILRRLIGEDIKVAIELPADIWTVKADASRIEQVIMNLAVNARDAMPEGGNLTIKTENITLDEKDSGDIPESSPGKFVKLSVQDNGTGMSREIMPNIFEPFFTTKGVGKGTGLGLSAVYGIIKQHTGWINASSAPGKGSIFTIYLPAVPSEKPEPEAKETAEFRDITGHGEKILFVDDEEGIRKYAGRALSNYGYAVFLARNVKEALEIYEKEKGSFKLVISDVILPDKIGTELVSRLISADPKLKVIFISGYLDDKSQYEIIHEKGYKFFQKPFELNTLLAGIKEALNT